MSRFIVAVFSVPHTHAGRLLFFSPPSAAARLSASVLSQPRTSKGICSTDFFAYASEFSEHVSQRISPRTGNVPTGSPTSLASGFQPMTLVTHFSLPRPDLARKPDLFQFLIHISSVRDIYCPRIRNTCPIHLGIRY